MLRGVIGGLQRWQYRGGRPRWSARITQRWGSIIFAAGIGPNQAARLELRGHKSGRTISFPVVVADYEAERYLVAMLGQQTNWVRNLRAGDGRAVLQHGQREDVSLVEDLHYPSRLLRIRYHAVAQYISPTRESWSRRAS